MSDFESICDNCSRPLHLRPVITDADGIDAAQTCEGCGGTFCAECIGDLDHECEALR